MFLNHLQIPVFFYMFVFALGLILGIHHWVVGGTVGAQSLVSLPLFPIIPLFTLYR